MNQDTLKLIEAELISWKAARQQVTTSDLEHLAASEELALAIVEALWIVVGSRKVHEVRVEVPLLIKSTEEGRLCPMILRLLEPSTSSAFSGKWMCKPDALGKFKVLDGFSQSLENARSAVNALDSTHAIWPEESPFVVQWEFVTPPSEGIDGGSAGCILALGLVELFKGANLIDTEHRLHSTIKSKKAFPFTHLTASAQIDAAGYLLPVEPEGLTAKEQAAGMKAMTFLVLSRQQTRTVKMAAAATRQDLPCSNLSEALLKISALLGEETELRVIHPRRWRNAALTLASVLGLILMLFTIYQRMLAYPPSEWALRHQGLADSVFVDFSDKPDDCDFGIRMESTTDYTWVTRIWPTLANVRSNFALSIGDSGHYPNILDRVLLGSFGELPGLRTLFLDHSEVAVLQGAENLENLETFVDMGARVSDLRWLADMPRLRTVVLDSGFAEYYPREFPETVETLIVRFPASETFVSLISGNGDNLKRLALRGDGVTSITDLALQVGLKEVILHLEEITERGLKFSRENEIESFELARCRDLRFMSLDMFPRLKKLRLLGTQIDKLHATAAHDCLEELEITDDPLLEALDVSCLPNLKKLVITGTQIQHIDGLDAPAHLSHLEVSGVNGETSDFLMVASSLRHLKISNCPELTELDLSYFPLLESLEISRTGLTHLKGLENVMQLQSLKVRGAPLGEVRGLKHLSKLKTLSLAETQIHSLESLKELSCLESVDLSETGLRQFPELGGVRPVKLTITKTPLHIEIGGSPFYRWSPAGGTASANANDFEAIADDHFGGYDLGDWTTMPFYTYNTYSWVGMNDAFGFQVIDGVGRKIGFDGWELAPTTQPALPRFDTRAIVDMWDIVPEIHVGTPSVAKYHTPPVDPVAPFVDPKKGKEAAPIISK